MNRFFIQLHRVHGSFSFFHYVNINILRITKRSFLSFQSTSNWKCYFLPGKPPEKVPLRTLENKRVNVVII